MQYYVRSIVYIKNIYFVHTFYVHKVYSILNQYFKFLAVQEPTFLKPKFGQDRPLTGFCMYIGPARFFLSLLRFDLGVM